MRGGGTFHKVYFTNRSKVSSLVLRGSLAGSGRSFRLGLVRSVGSRLGSFRLPRTHQHQRWSNRSSSLASRFLVSSSSTIMDSGIPGEGMSSPPSPAAPAAAGITPGGGNPPGFLQQTSGSNNVVRSLKTWSAEGLSQLDLMHKDECILVDTNDKLIGHDNKYNSHTLTHDSFSKQPHRAFSVFLLTTDNKLVLQQRASSKVTFPLAWTNTCCSHPLHGQIPDEVSGARVDGDDEMEAAKRWRLPGDEEVGSTVLGCIRAARRKLEHELGIAPEDVPVSSFAFLGRIYYRAPSDDTWGEHEVDYLFLCKPRGGAMGANALGGGDASGGEVPLRPNPEEVEAVRNVTLDELRELLAEADACEDGDANGLKISPWFRLIADRLLAPWWEHAAAGDLVPKTHGLPSDEVRNMELGDIDGATGRRRP
uniref:isopentenyl-diphosphate Delta-isomerase n=1 Tax=Pycnococcus provasolii TaxID=41880 RepID=A0A7S3DZH3_9CHLO|mmetsp:Transcript_3102/g.8001  ORF Transcript_3102/g.8001 Transcript_3102/m.8001 type:complete len:423 (+) Transcript_3102:42-1310(+)